MGHFGTTARLRGNNPALFFTVHGWRCGAMAQTARSARPARSPNALRLTAGSRIHIVKDRIPADRLLIAQLPCDWGVSTLIVSGPEIARRAACWHGRILHERRRVALAFKEFRRIIPFGSAAPASLLPPLPCIRITGLRGRSRAAAPCLLWRGFADPFVARLNVEIEVLQLFPVCHLPRLPTLDFPINRLQRLGKTACGKRSAQGLELFPIWEIDFGGPTSLTGNAFIRQSIDVCAIPIGRGK